MKGLPQLLIGSSVAKIIAKFKPQVHEAFCCKLKKNNSNKNNSLSDPALWTSAHSLDR